MERQMWLVEDAGGQYWMGLAHHAEDAQDQAIAFWEMIESPHDEIVVLRPCPRPLITNPPAATAS